MKIHNSLFYTLASLVTFIALNPPGAIAYPDSGTGETALSILNLTTYPMQLFEKDPQTSWLVQQSVSYRNYLGSFNQPGAFTNTPNGLGYQSVINTLSIYKSFGPESTSKSTPEEGDNPKTDADKIKEGVEELLDKDSADDAGILGIQLPFIYNTSQGLGLSGYSQLTGIQAQTQTGMGLGDLGLQYIMPGIDLGFWKMSTWYGVSMPLGSAVNNNPANVTSSGQWIGQTGISNVFGGAGKNVALGLGYQGARYWNPQSTITPWGSGDGLIYQLLAQSTIVPKILMVGCGINGYLGTVFTQELDETIKLVPWRKIRGQFNVQYDPSEKFGFRAGMGVDPPIWGRNSAADITFNLTAYQRY
jgi:hypothetical protein